MSRSAAIRLVDTRSLEREQWLEVRKQGIGSSDAAAAVGLCPYKSQLELWMDKTGRTGRGEEPGQSDPMYWGTLLEPFVAAAYTERTERKVRRVNAVLQHPTYSFMLANIDREVVGVPDVQILECKTAGEFGSRLWRDGVPEYVQLQVQHQLAVTGKQAADVAVLLCGQRLEVHRIERDEEVISRLIVLEARFWEHVTQDTQPPADGSESAARALRSLYTGNDTCIDFSEDAELSATFNGLVLLRDEIAQMDKRAEQMRQQLEQSMGEASRALFPTGEITYRRSKDGTSVDLKGLGDAYPDLVAQFTVQRPGSRRFRIVPDPN
ncbi:YqaJ viral recombinase family nuclease [Luteimonas sp. A649]